MIRSAYRLLGLKTFYTVGPKEARAWTVRHDATAYDAAGAIHTDFQRGFIRAEVIAYDSFIRRGGEQGAREAGAEVAVKRVPELVPEAVAFAFVAGVSPLIGLYSAFFLCLIAAVVGGRPGMISVPLARLKPETSAEASRRVFTAPGVPRTRKMRRL